MNAEIVCPNCTKEFGACLKSLPKFCYFCGFKLPLSIVLDTELHHEKQKEVISSNPLIAERIQLYEGKKQSNKCTDKSHVDRALQLKKVGEIIRKIKEREDFFEIDEKIRRLVEDHADTEDIRFCAECGQLLPQV